MTATDSLPASPARAPGAVRESWQRESKAAGDAVSIFADMVAEAAGRLDDTPAPARDAGPADDEAARRSPSPDDVVASVASLPSPGETRAAGQGHVGHGESASPSGARPRGTQERPEAGDRAGAAGDRSRVAADGPAAATADGAKPAHASPAAATVTLATDAARAPLEGEPSGDAPRHGASAAQVAATKALAVTSLEENASSTSREVGRTGAAAQADGPGAQPGPGARRAVAGAGSAAAAHQLQEASGQASGRATTSTAASAATASGSANGAAGNAAAATAVAAAAAAAATGTAAPGGTGTGAGERNQAIGARRGTVDAARASAGSRALAGDRSAGRRNEMPDAASTRFGAAGAEQAAGNGTSTANATPSPSQPSPAPGAGSFAAAVEATGTASGSDLAADPALRADPLGIDIPVQDEAFAEAFARQATHLVVQGSNRAEIHLTPRDLGPVRIAIAIDADAASLEIAADRQETRTAIEASMPTLRQMLAEQGVRLSDWRVAGDAADRRQAAAGDAGSGAGGHAHGGNDGGTPHDSARGLPQPAVLAGHQSKTGPGTGDRAGTIPSAAHATPRPDMSRGGNRLDLFA